jgi:DNA (cytosine-5)-methyltransferase 1
VFVLIVRAKLPRYVILENVKNLAGPRHAETFKVIVASLREAGYKISSKPLIISPHALPPELGGTPQHRERVFLLAEYAFAANTTRDLQVQVDHRAIEDWDPQNWNLDDILVPDSEIEDLEKFRLSEEDNAAVVAWNEFVQGIPVDNLPGFPIWADCFETKTNFPNDTPAWKVDFINKNNAFYEEHKSFLDVWLKKSWIDGRTLRVQDFTASKRKFEWQARKSQALASQRDLWKLAIQFRPSGIRVKGLTYLPTLVAITQTSFIGPRRRFLTPLEAGRMQGFPDRVFELATINSKNAYKQAGNAVHVGVARFLASELFDQTQAPWLHK